MKLTEAEIQVMATMHHLAQQTEECIALMALEQSGGRYWLYKEDWKEAFDTLESRGLLIRTGNDFQLTEAGRKCAQTSYEERPDRYAYYYRDFYRKAHESKAHSRLCELVFGMDLTQEGQVDMDSLHHLMSILDLEPGTKLLDLGCGAGGISEYISDQTGALVTGLEYSPVAVEVATERTMGKRDRLQFLQGDLNNLTLVSGSYDAVVMVDSIYWADDTASCIRDILDSIRTGGKLVITIVHMLEYCTDPAELDIQANFVATGLQQLGLDYDALDATSDFLPFWPRVRDALDELQQDFRDEGNEIIYQSLLNEAETEFLPAIENGDIRRYVYTVEA